MAGMRAMMQSVSLQEQYDENAKWLISQKPFLANILVRTVKEFENGKIIQEAPAGDENILIVEV